MACEHKRTHPSHCDDCGGLRCYVCRTYHKPTSPAVCMDALHADRASLRTRLAARTAEVEALREALHPFAEAADALAGYRDIAVITEYPLKFCISFTNGAGPDTIPVLHGRDFAQARAALAPKEKNDAG